MSTAWHLSQFFQPPVFESGLIYGQDSTGVGFDLSVNGASYSSTPQSQGQSSAPIGGNAVIAKVQRTAMILGYGAFTAPDDTQPA